MDAILVVRMHMNTYFRIWSEIPEDKVRRAPRQHVSSAMTILRRTQWPVFRTRLLAAPPPPEYVDVSIVCMDHVQNSFPDQLNAVKGPYPSDYTRRLHNMLNRHSIYQQQQQQRNDDLILNRIIYFKFFI